MMSLLAEFTKTVGVRKVPLPRERVVSLRPRSQHEPQIGQGWYGALPAKTAGRQFKKKFAGTDAPETSTAATGDGVGQRRTSPCKSHRRGR